MKKSIIILTVAIMVITLCSVVFADTIKYITAEVADYTIKLNGTAVEDDISVVTIDGRAYVPVRDLGEMAGFGVNWNEEESAIEVSTGTVQGRYIGENDREQVDLSISEENAIIIADIAFAERCGEDYLNETEMLPISESEDRSMYCITRVDKSTKNGLYDGVLYITDGGGYTVYIRKSDGKIMEFRAGE